MSADELLPGTSAYNLQYGAHSCNLLRSPTPSSHSDNDDDEQMSLTEALEDPLIWQHSREDAQDAMEERIENLRLRSERLNAESANLISSLRSDSERRRILRQMVEHEDEQDVDYCEHVADESYTGAAGVSAPTPPPFTVTTATEDDVETDSNDELPSPAIMADRMRRESRWREDSDEEEGEEITQRIGPLRRALPLDFSSYSEWQERRERYLEPIRAARIAAPNRIEPLEPAPETDTLIPPNAKFFIAKNKNKITIKFHPAM